MFYPAVKGIRSHIIFRIREAFTVEVLEYKAGTRIQAWFSSTGLGLGLLLGLGLGLVLGLQLMLRLGSGLGMA